MHIDVLKFASLWARIEGNGSGHFKTSFYQQTFIAHANLHAQFDGLSPRQRSHLISTDYKEQYKTWRNRMNAVVNARNRFLRLYNLVCHEFILTLLKTYCAILGLIVWGGSSH